MKVNMKIFHEPPSQVRNQLKQFPEEGLKNFQACTRFEPTTLRLLSELIYVPTELLSQLGAGHFSEIFYLH